MAWRTARTDSRRNGQKVVEVNFCVPPDTETEVTKYFVMTSIARYVNAYTNIAQRPNAKLVFDHD